MIPQFPGSFLPYATFLICVLAFVANSVAQQSAIARWDSVPFREVSGKFRVGIVAFHPNGIKYVDFSINGSKSSRCEKLSRNPDSDIVEYWCEFDGSTFPNGPLEVTANVQPVEPGIARRLEGQFGHSKIGDGSLFLFNGLRPNESEVYVSNSGSDENSGTREHPQRTVVSALNSVKDGGRVIILDKGRYPLLGKIEKQSASYRNLRWVTIEPVQGLSREDVIIAQESRAVIRLGPSRLRWKGISFDFSTIVQYCTEVGVPVWFDQTKWYDSKGWDATYSPHLSPIRSDVTGGVYITSAICKQMRYGFTNCSHVTNSSLKDISGDALQNSQFICNVSVETMRTKIPGLHKDVLQMWGGHENTIVYGLRATDLETTQGIFLQTGSGWKGGEKPRFLDCAFIDITIESNSANEKNSSQFEGPFKNVYFRNLELRKQRLLIRTNLNQPEKFKFPFSAENVILENCRFVHPIPIIRGVLIK